LAGFYENGSQIVEQSYENALIFAFYSAYLGNVQAMDTIASFYNRGLGVAQDSAKALVWFEAALQRGDAWAAYNIYVMHRDGNSVVTASEESAIKYSKLSTAWSQVKETIASAEAYEQSVKSAEYIQQTAFHQEDDDDDDFIDFDEQEEDVLEQALQGFDFHRLRSDLPQNQQGPEDDEDAEELVTPLAAQTPAATKPASGALDFDDIVSKIRSGNNPKPATSSTTSKPVNAVEPAKKTPQRVLKPSASAISAFGTSPLARNNDNRSLVIEQNDDDQQSAFAVADGGSEKSIWWQAAEYAVAGGALLSFGTFLYKHFK